MLSADIRPQPVASALAEFAHQTGLQFIYVSQIANARASKGARAGLTPAEALPLLLEGTGLDFQFLNGRTVRIFEPAGAPLAVRSTASDAPKQRVSRRAPSSGGRDDEIFVTASRRADDQSMTQELQSVPASVSVVSGARLEAQHLEQLSDYAAYLPD